MSVISQIAKTLTEGMKFWRWRSSKSFGKLMKKSNEHDKKYKDLPSSDELKK